MSTRARVGAVVVLLCLTSCMPLERVQDLAAVEAAKARLQQQRASILQANAQRIAEASRALASSLPVAAAGMPPDAADMLADIAEDAAAIHTVAGAVGKSAANSESWNAGLGSAAGPSANPPAPDSPQEEIRLADFRRRVRVLAQVARFAGGVLHLPTRRASPSSPPMAEADWDMTGYAREGGQAGVIMAQILAMVAMYRRMKRLEGTPPSSSPSLASGSESLPSSSS